MGRERTGIQVLLISGYFDEALTENGVSLTGRDFLHKPLSPRQLAMKVREILDRPVTRPGQP